MSDLLLSDQRLNQKHWSDLRVDASPFRSVFEYAAIGMVVADTDGRRLAANRAFCEMVGDAEDELLNLEFAPLTHPDDLPENLRLGRRLIAGEIFISPALADKWAILQHRPNGDDPIAALSSRERQVLQLVAVGQSNPLIAERLLISVRTVEVHRRNIIDKLGVKNTAQLIKFAVECGVI